MAFFAQEDTIDSIVSDIQVKVDKLRTISDNKREEAVSISDEIMKLEKKVEATLADQTRASKLADNFEKLIDV